jgi:ParB-like chromosome segregation protein Spo0J
MSAEFDDTSKYQFYGPPTDAGYALLRDSITDEGVTAPVLIDEDGEIIDGHQRAKIARELGIEYPTFRIAGLTDEQKERKALTANVNSRTAQEKREAIRNYLLRHPETADRQIGRLVGVHGQTVAKVRSELEASAEIMQIGERVTERQGKPLKQKTRKPDPELVAKRQAELEASRTRSAEQRAKKDAEYAAEYDKIRAGAEARGGISHKNWKPASRVVSSQDRIKAALSDANRALIRVLQDPGLDIDLIRAESELHKDLQLETQRLKLYGLIKELGVKLKGLTAESKKTKLPA